MDLQGLEAQDHQAHQAQLVLLVRLDLQALELQEQEDHQGRQDRAELNTPGKANGKQQLLIQSMTVFIMMVLVMSVYQHTLQEILMMNLVLALLGRHIGTY